MSTSKKTQHPLDSINGDMKNVGRKLSSMFTEMKKLNNNLGINDAQGEGGNSNRTQKNDSQTRDDEKPS